MEQNMTDKLSDSVNPDQVPKRQLPNGDTMPAIGLGTFGNDSVNAQTIADAVYDAAMVGYRHFDCAAVYGNEKEIGCALQKVMNTGIKREDLWITSKLWNDQHKDNDVLPAFRKSLDDLQLDYLDLYLIHWPFPNFHPPHCDVTSRSKDAMPYIHDDYMRVWRHLERLVRIGLVRHIGTSNMTIPKLKLLLRDADIKPVVNEMELHPHFQQPELFKYVTDNGMIPIAYSPVGSPARPERDRTPDDTVDIEDPVIVEIAGKYNIHPATLAVKWSQQRGSVPIPFSVKRRNYLANLQSVISEPLTAEEMTRIAAIDKNCRLIKGQVFLWKDGQEWTDLWDLDGNITK
jgi:diketogulonate reductase-like aldo/keto reductase